MIFRKGQRIAQSIRPDLISGRDRHANANARRQYRKSADGEGLIPPTATPESQPAAEQQQQVQPKNDDKKE
jgi:hypothetical protein